MVVLSSNNHQTPLKETLAVQCPLPERPFGLAVDTSFSCLSPKSKLGGNWTGSLSTTPVWTLTFRLMRKTATVGPQSSSVRTCSSKPQVLQTCRASFCTPEIIRRLSCGEAASTMWMKCCALLVLEPRGHLQRHSLLFTQEVEHRECKDVWPKFTKHSSTR